MNGSGQRDGFRVEDFVTALTAQLDRAQDALVIKAQTGQPLTFALKDLSIDLQVFLDADSEGNLLLRHAGPNESGASTMRLSFTTITKAMVEENTRAFGLDEDPRQLTEIKTSLREEDMTQLRRVGVRTVGQFKRLAKRADPREVESRIGIPVANLQAALLKSTEPRITGREVFRRHADGKKARRLLRIRGANLENGSAPEVHLSGEPVEVLESSASELVVRPMSHHREGTIDVYVGDRKARGFYELDDTEGTDSDEEQLR